jgi:voltage-gated potassium channel
MIRPLRIVMILGALNKLNRQTGLALRGRIALYVCISATILVLVGSLAVFDAERGVAGANIKSFGEALWWAFVTITTVGYGDYSPVSPTGRIIAFALMIAGIALIGVVTAMLASWIVERVGAQENKDLQITREQVERLSGQLAHIEIELKKLETSQKPHNISASGRSDLKPFGK